LKTSPGREFASRKLRFRPEDAEQCWWPLVRDSILPRRAVSEGGRQRVDDADGFQADADDLGDEAEDVFGVGVAVGVGADAGAGVFGDAILIDHPFEG